MDGTYTNTDPVKYYKFCEQLSSQITQYDSREEGLYPEVELMQISTTQPAYKGLARLTH